MSLKRILFINYEFPPLGGGGGHANERIAKELVKSGYQVSVLTSRFKGLPKAESRFGFQIYRIPTLRRHKEKCSVFEMFVFMLSSLFFALRYYFKLKPQIVISFFSIPCGPAAFLIRCFFRVPYILALRGGDVPGFLPEQLAKFHKMTNWLTRLVWWRASGITTNSEGLGELARNFYDKREITVIPNGVDRQFYFDRLGEGATGRGGDSALLILTVGRLSKQKKVERLIESMHRLSKTEHNEIKLNIVGDGPERARLEKLAIEYNILDKTVFFLGWCDRDEIVKHYRAADVFALSSDFEGMPNVVLEAMASSLALVATRSPGTVELVHQDQNGYLVFKDNLEKLDESFLTLLKNREKLNQFQQYSYKLATEYTWENVSRDYERLVSSIWKR